MNAHYLITGGAGSLGREITGRILRSEPGARIAILLRARNPHGAEVKWEELLRFLAHYGHAASLSRVIPVLGDVGRPALGLSRSVGERLRRRTTHIIHAAASINLRMPLAAAREINVTGTREALSFAESCDGLERFVHLSTAYVAGERTGVIREDEGDLGQRFRNTYEQSKCEAEALLLDAAPRLPVSIARPSIIVGNSGDGRTCNFGTLYGPLRRIAEGSLRNIPGDPDTPLDLVPVDYVADCVAAISQTAAGTGAVYHVTAGSRRAIPAGELIGTIARLAGKEPPRFIARAGLASSRDAVAMRARARMDAFFAYLTGVKAFDDAALRRDFAVRECPDPRAYLPNLYSFCVSTRWGRELPWDGSPMRAAA